MKTLAMTIGSVLMFSVFTAQAEPKACEELKAEIASKLDAKGVKGYVLEVVPTEQVGEAKVVGSCEGGTKKITYSKK